jgi:dihydrofolate reductase
MPLCDMPRPTRIEGLAIVSADGMLAGADGHMPKSLLVEADQQFFQDTLDQAAVLVQGRHSHEGSPRAAHRRRLVLTRRIADIAEDTTYPNALLWNPKGATLQHAWDRLGAPDGMLAVIGGTEVYDLFLTIGFDRFHLSHAPRVRLPGGRPVFPEVGAGRTPEEVLASHGLKPGPQQVFDAELGVTMVTWSR